MKTMKDYHNLHLKCEVLLFADVFEKFRNNSLKNYGLCPNRYLSTPALSRMQCLIWQKCNSNLFQILTCTYYLKKGTKGGVSYILMDIVKLTTNIWNIISANFIDKEKYVIHYENVKLYLRLGLKLKKSIAY